MKRKNFGRLLSLHLLHCRFGLRGEKKKDRGEAQQIGGRHVYSCSEVAELLERASKQRMAPRPAWPSPLARLSVFGL